MILYQDKEHLESVLEPVIAELAKRGGLCSLVSPMPVEDSKFLKGVMRRAGGPKGELGPMVSDARDLLLESPDPLQSFLDLWGQMKDEYQPRPHGWTNIGCFPHLFYNRPEILLGMERWLNLDSPPAEIICCYRNEGFCSLDPIVTLELLETHQRVQFRTVVF
jgi:hypothetical protein